MGNRLSKIYTRTGDKGTTGLGDGSRVDKDSTRVNAYGTVDELNSTLGMVLAEDLPAQTRMILEAIQHQLFDLGGELCIPGHQAIQQTHVDWLERALDAENAALPALKEFILPGGGRAASACHLARTICRRAERETVTLQREEELQGLAAAYLNRLSDLLFVLGRVIARHERGSEVLWQPQKDLPHFEDTPDE